MKFYFAMLGVSAALFVAAPQVHAGDFDNTGQASGANCTFLAHRDDFLSSQLRARQHVAATVNQANLFTKLVHAEDATIDPASLTHRNFIDDIVLGGLVTAKVPAAPLTTDTEFIRRITLDLTGRIPSSTDIKTFVADTTPQKRDILIDKLLDSPEYIDKWTMWLGDLFQNVSSASNVSVGVSGRDSFYNYLRNGLSNGTSFRDFAYQLVTATGDTGNYVSGGPTNFVYRNQTPMGPVQDSFDTAMARTGDILMGITYYDCLLCHSGKGHLDAISLWGGQVTRTDAESMAAFFSRLNFNMPRSSTDPTDPMYNSWHVAENTSTGYALNTNYGNRPNRVPVGTVKVLTPLYYGTGSVPASGQNWRDAFAQQLIRDPMFARNFANRMFKAFFNLGLVDPVDTMDPARLDPKNPPAAPWTLQAAIPQLLDQLATQALYSNFNFKDYMRILVQSTSYQLSSRYDATWNINDIPLFARHYPRRIDAEEAHDAVGKATGVMGNYNVNGTAAPLIQWAMQLPDPLANSGSGANLLNSFLRGNRDTVPRSSDASILQRLTTMNDTFVTSRTKVAASPELLAVSKMTDNNAIIEELFLTFISREPTASEKASAMTYLAAATTPTMTAAAATTAKNSAIEDLAWALINKIEFLYSY